MRYCHYSIIEFSLVIAFFSSIVHARSLRDANKYGCSRSIFITNSNDFNSYYSSTVSNTFNYGSKSLVKHALPLLNKYTMSQLGEH